RDSDRCDVARPVPIADGLHECRLLRADPERVRRVLDVHALEHLAVPCLHRRADEIVRVRRVGPLRDRDSTLVQLFAHSSWNTERVTRAPIAPPYATSRAECTPASTRV